MPAHHRHAEHQEPEPPQLADQRQDQAAEEEGGPEEGRQEADDCQLDVKSLAHGGSSGGSYLLISYGYGRTVFHQVSLM